MSGILCGCPHCRQPVTITEEVAGQAVCCPYCRRIFTSPPRALVVQQLPVPEPRRRGLLQKTRDVLIGPPSPPLPPKPFQCPLCGTMDPPIVKQVSNSGNWGLLVTVVTGSLLAPFIFSGKQPAIVCQHCGKVIKT